MNDNKENLEIIKKLRAENRLKCQDLVCPDCHQTGWGIAGFTRCHRCRNLMNEVKTS